MKTEHVEQVVRETLHDMSESASAPTPPDFAARVLRARRRRRARTATGIALGTAAVVAAAVAVPAVDFGGERSGPADSAAASADVLARPGQSPPRDLVAAGDTAVSGWRTSESEKLPNGDVVFRSVWHLHNPDTGRYEKTEWAWADVAPGLRTAAVLERELPAERIGIVDLATGSVDRWIPLERKVASVFWSPDGSRLLATTYSKNPDRRFQDHPVNVNGKEKPGELPSRTGYYLIDVDSGDARWFDLPYEEDEHGITHGSRDDLRWSSDGSHVFDHRMSSPPKQFYDLQGRESDGPTGANRAYSAAGLSPGGRYAAGDFAGDEDEIATEVLDPETGDEVAEQPVQELLAWADGDRLLAWRCGPEKCSEGEYRQQLVLVDVQGKQVRQLTGYRDGQSRKSWYPVFSSR